MASITVRLVDGRNTRASRLCIPQSRLAEPLRVYGCGRAGTDAANRAPSLRLSLSAMMLFFRLWALGGGPAYAPAARQGGLGRPSPGGPSIPGETGRQAPYPSP